jgi:sRNA-binding regulator protein Hfq
VPNVFRLQTGSIHAFTESGPFVFPVKQMEGDVLHLCNEESWSDGGFYFMNSQSILPGVDSQRRAADFFATHRRNQSSIATPSFRFTNHEIDENAAHRQAEQFYLQKQIQSQTPMVIVLEDGEKLEGQIEWYDRSVLKVRGRSKILIYKSAIKYMYKLGEAGQ